MGVGERVCVLVRLPPLERLIQLVLETDNIEPVVCSSDAELIAAWKTHDTQLSIIDVGLASDGGPALLARAKHESAQPIIATSTGDDITAARVSLQAGADEYLGRPFSSEVLLEHVHFLLGRPRPTGETGLYGSGSIQLDLGRRTLTARGERVRLSRTEWRLLRALVEKAGEPVFYADLARSAFDREFRDDPDYLAMWVARLQEKLVTGPSGTSPLRRFHDIALILDVQAIPG